MKKENTKYVAISQRMRAMALTLVMCITIQVVTPTAAFALTGGPSQPEVQGFQPIGTTEMVDKFTGDFSYNLPLMDVGGYPINLSYKSGITMDEEASWVGLGWSLNPGVINRTVRGIPDDFNGDKIKKEQNMKANVTVGASIGTSVSDVEIFGLDPKRFGISADFSMGFKWNNYNGIGIEKSATISSSIGKNVSSPFTGSLGLTSSSADGITIAPKVSFSQKIEKSNFASISGFSISVGTAINSRSGMKELSVTAKVDRSPKEASNSNTGQMTKEEEKKLIKKGKLKNLANEAIAKLQSVNATFDFGMPTYTPSVSLPMLTSSYSGRFTVGAEVFGAHPNGNVSAYMTIQNLLKKETENPAYGYFNYQNGTDKDDALLDFNREKDGSFNSYTSVLPVTNLTFDIFSVSGHGVGGSYRAFRSDMGQVFDPSVKSYSFGVSDDVEVGVGNAAHSGGSRNGSISTSSSGKWKSGKGNKVSEIYKFKGDKPGSKFEPFYMKEANEKTVETDPSFAARMRQKEAVAIKISKPKRFQTTAEKKFSDDVDIDHNNERLQRDIRNQTISFTKAEDLQSFSYSKRSKSAAAENHHIGEVTCLGTDGMRYVYGQAAYNNTQKEATFAIGTGLYGNDRRQVNWETGLVTDYQHGKDDSKDNRMGLDHFYTATITPGYAHSYLITAILSSDYVDSDGIPGPSQDDMGSYTKFDYTAVTNYKWRMPYEKASFSEGMRSNQRDDKGNYIYGEKDLYYLTSIENKNYIAVFELNNESSDPRLDAVGVKGPEGGRDANSKRSRYLKSISLYQKDDYKVNVNSAAIIKKAVFKYNYSLCPGIPNWA
jgi:hypothetical protein